MNNKFCPYTLKCMKNKIKKNIRQDLAKNTESKLSLQKNSAEFNEKTLNSNGYYEKTNKKSQNDGMFIKFIITYQATLPLLLFWSKILDKSMIFCS